ncbi:branched-chain amino acid ABC transporter permease [Bradyrhizobium sp. JYMT SZCCT0428]|uniref:branched-chain amino acid ABC transporter permease n=1 Tax=Bradyrhizobium sp. JYMT SZCCT0428 TaxID=2807673 RepID=UPI001BA5490B|nr:branched-chain amino acid ABC transporter permease [Bradyrhizobium sp. JYMT SZCCT0428]MBR1152774.1 branched-chain amino acid ABC transporter permease [Bradyrhizobium sp. JYMT SZCCT0428]
MDYSILLAQAVLNGLVIGVMYMLMAVGFTLVFGIMRVVNFAHGEFYMLGAFTGFFTYVYWEIPFIVCLLIAALTIGILGMLVERTLIQPFRSDEMSGMIATLAISVIIQNGAVLLWGPQPRAMPDIVTGTLAIGPFSFPWSRLVVIAAAALIFTAFWLFMQRTRLGRAMRAVAQDTETALIQGIRVNYIYPLAFGMSVALAALAGALMGPVFSVSPFVGLTPMLKAFVVVILGGLGSVPGAVVGGLLLGMIESFTATIFGSLMSDILQLLLVILILLVRPAGLLGQREA